jgi:drug/metabolite transporter superfamily protein YnfA
LLKLFQVLAGLVPLAGAAMIVGGGRALIEPERFRIFQVMVVGLIALGMFGFVFALKTAESVKRTVAAFTGAKGV